MKPWPLTLSVALHAAVLSLTVMGGRDPAPRTQERRVVAYFFIEGDAGQPTAAAHQPGPTPEPRAPVAEPSVAEPSVAEPQVEVPQVEVPPAVESRPPPRASAPLATALPLPTTARAPEVPTAIPAEPATPTPQLATPEPAVPAAPSPPGMSPSAPAPRQAQSHLPTPSRPATAPASLALTPVRALDTPRPRYPRRSRSRGHQGTVLLQAVIDITGAIKSVTILESSGHRALDREAERCLREVRFEPARRGKRAVEATIELPIQFRLE